MKYRPDIDGLRAIAVMLVVFYHGHLAFSGGYVGVDVFFVISGYLITSIVLKKIKDDQFSFKDFWRRRVRRLIPALAVTTLCTGLLGTAILLPEDLEDLGGAMVAQPLMLVNVYFWRVAKGGYFGDDPEIRFMLHAWSLSLEEQFYLFFPLFLLLVARLRRASKQVFFLVGIVSFLLSCGLTPHKPTFAFYNLPTRAWEFLLRGSLVFLPSLKAKLMVKELVCWLGIGLIFYSAIQFHEYTLFPGWLASLPCVGAALVILSNSGTTSTRLGTLLSWAPLVTIGKMSYSLYLWHWPIMAAAMYLGLFDSRHTRWLSIGLSFLLGYISWRWVEQPFRSRVGRKTLTSTRIYLAYFLSSTFVGLVFLASGGLRFLWQDAAQAPLIRTELRSRTLVSDLEVRDPVLFPIGKSSEKSTFLIVGDSHAMSLSPLFHELGSRYGLSGFQFTTDLSKLKRDLAKGEDARWFDVIKTTVKKKELSTVFFVGYWHSYSDSSFFEKLSGLCECLKEQGVEVVLVADVPALDKNPDRATRLAYRWPFTKLEMPGRAEHLLETSESRRSLDEVAEATGARVVDPAPVVLAWSSVYQDGGMTYYDQDHLTDHGALLLEAVFVPFFAGDNSRE